MSDTSSKPGGSSTSWSVPAMIAAVLALFGVATLPGNRETPTGREGGTSSALPAADRAEAARPIERTRMELLLDSHRLDQGGSPGPGAAKLQILEPLLRFYAPRLARLDDRGLTDDHPEGKYAPDKVVTWMTSRSSTGDELKVLISLVPDPSRSGSAYRFDSTITAMLLALRNAGFVLDNYQINWRSATGRRIDLATAEATPGRVRIILPGASGGGPHRLPGAILLRKQKLPEPPAGGPKVDEKVNPAPHELVLLLLVPETPVAGVDTGIFQTSLDLAHECERQQGRRTVRIIGPHFSGSASSILRTLISWLRQPAPLPEGTGPVGPTDVHWINGGALSLDVDRIQYAFDRSLGAGRVVLRNVIYGSVDLDSVLFAYINKYATPAVGNHRIAFLTEETTGYGELATKDYLPFEPAAAASTAPRRRWERTGSPRSLEQFKVEFETYRFTFPLHISEMRRRYARQDPIGGQSPFTLRTAERLRFDEEEQTDKPELVRAESPTFSSASDELRLLRVAEQINRRGIRIVWLSATDLRDRLFLAEFLRINCPDVQIVGPLSEPPFTHNQRIARLRGILFASTHPMWDAGDRRHPLTLPEHPAFGTYNATLAHLCELGPFEKYDGLLADYDWTGPNRTAMGPALWVTVASQKGHLPLEVTIPPEGTGPRTGKYANSLWLPENILKGFDLKLMPSVSDVEDIPTEGKNLVIVANVNKELHFRIFDADGQKVVTTNERLLASQAESIATLKEQLEDLWSRHRLTEAEKDRVAGAVTSIAVLTRVQPDPSVINGGTPYWLTFQRLSLTSGVSWVLPLLFGLAAILTCWFCLAKNQRIRRDHLGFPSRYPLPYPGDNHPTPMADLLICPAQQAKELTAFANPTTALMYRHPGLAALALASFFLMGLYALYSAHYLSSTDWFLPVFVMMLMLTYASWEVFRRWKIPRVTTDAPQVWPSLFTALLGSALFWCVLRLGAWIRRPDAWNAFEARELELAVLVCLALLVVVWRGLALSVGNQVLARGRAVSQKLRRQKPPGVEGRETEAAQGPPRGDDCREAKLVPPSVIFGVILGGTLLGFLTFSMVTQEPSPSVSLLLMLGLAFLYGAVIHEALHLREYWSRLNALTESVLSLPLGTTLDHLPRRLTSRLGSFSEVWGGSADFELTERFRHVRQTLAAILAEDAAASASPGPAVRKADLEEVRDALASANTTSLGGTQVSRALTRLLAPAWSHRVPIEAFADQDFQRAEPTDRPTEQAGDTAAPDGAALATDRDIDPAATLLVTLPARSVEIGEMYLALEVVRYLNRHFDILWIRVSALTVLTLLLMAAVNCYPFQPAGTLFQWTMLVVVLALVMIVRVLVGFNRNELISRVNRIPTGRSLWNLDFLGKVAAYVGPVIALLAALSVGLSDLIRLVLGPLIP